MKSLTPKKKTRAGYPALNNDFFSTMRNLQKDLDDLFESPLSQLTPSWSEFGKSFSPCVDVTETDKEYKVKMEIPGMDKDDLDISLKDNILIVQGEKREEEEKKDEGYLRRESHYGHFYRTVPFEEEVNTKKIKAKMKNGILKITLEKNPEASTPSQRIDIQEEI